MRGKLGRPGPEWPPSSPFNEARALCAGNWEWRGHLPARALTPFNEARALCAGN